MPLKSYIFAKDPVFEKCLADHAAHIVPGSRGQHVRKIQGAIEAIDGTPFDENEWSTMTYGPVTAKSVLDYKIARDIINRNYQQSADNVVGKMTIERLDEDMTALETSAKDSSSSRCEQRSTPSPTLLRAMAQGAGVQRRRPVENLPQTPDFLQSRGLIASGPVAPARSFGVGAPAGTIEIKKVGAAPTFGSDGYDDLAKFQMLPLGVTRQFTVSTFAVPCTIAIESGSNLARFVNIRDRDGRLLEPDALKTVTLITLPANSLVGFSLLGLQEGLGQVVARTNGKLNDVLVFSVKTSQSKSVRIWLVSDNTSRRTFMTEVRAPALLKASSDFYKSWTNTTLEMKGVPTLIAVPRDLLDPIDMSKASGNITRIGEEALLRRDSQADLHLFYTWDIKDYTDKVHEMFGITGGELSFVESTENLPANVNLTQTTAHELGHAMGLNHDSRRDSLMHEDTFRMVARLRMHEMNTINSTGMTPP